MKNLIMYHNPRCSTSRKTLELLHKNNIQPTIIEYLKTPPSYEELKRILKLLNISPRDLMRKKELIYHELNLDNDKLTDEHLIKTMVENPILIERPIVILNNKAVIGRPPENIMKII